MIISHFIIKNNFVLNSSSTSIIINQLRNIAYMQILIESYTLMNKLTNLVLGIQLKDLNYQCKDRQLLIQYQSSVF